MCVDVIADILMRTPNYG